MMRIDCLLPGYWCRAKPVIFCIASLPFINCGSERAPVAKAIVRPATAPVAARPSLAVLPCAAVPPVTRDQAEQARDFLEEEIARQNLYRLLDRAEIDKVTAEAALGMQGLVDARQAVQVGKFISARLLLTSKLSLSGGRYVITCRMIDSETGEVQNSAVGRVSDFTKLDGAAKGCVRRLLNQL